MLQISDKATEVIKQLQIKENKPDYGLRIGIRSGGCSGISYYFGFQAAPSENDNVLRINGIRIFIDQFSASMLRGAKLEYIEGIDGPGFVFDNPNVPQKKGCGCDSHSCA